MTPQEWVYKVCDRIHAKGDETVTNEAVIRAMRGKQRNPGLARGTVCLHVRNWKVEREYKPRLDVCVLPEPMQAGLTTFAGAVWAAAMVEATARLDDDRRRVEEERIATDGLLMEMGAQLEKRRATGKLQDLEVVRLREENAKLGAEVVRLPKRLDHIRAEEYWDRVMREIFALIPPRGTATAEEILPKLRQSTRRGARLHREPLDLDTLRKKMDVRVHHGKFFVRTKDGAYQREPRHLAAMAHGET